MRNFNLIISALVFVLQLTGQSNTVLQSQIDQILSSSEFENANVSLAVIDISNNELIAAHREKKVLVPASSIKAMFTLAAIDILGPDFKFVSNLSYDGSIEFDGTLKGNIYFEGSGDPSLGTTNHVGVLNFEDLMKNIVEEIKKEGITCIDGDIVADESFISTSPVSPSWQWNDLGNYYASGAWGINLNENLYRIHFSNRGIVGRRPKIKSNYPEVPNLKFSNEVVVDAPGTGDNAYIFGGPYNYFKRIVGTIPAGEGLFPIKGSIPDPPYFCAYHIQKSLEQSKIKTGVIRTMFTPDPNKLLRINIAKYKSPALSELVKLTNLESNNLYSEAITKTMGFKYNSLASGQNGIAALKNLMQKYKVKIDGMHLEDGSGLSARNQISAYTLSHFLAAFAKKNGFNIAVQYLPNAGSGTVRSMLSDTDARTKVWVKSGSMSRIQSYTGYVNTKTGNAVSFTMIVNGFDVSGSIIRSRLSKMIKEIYNHG